MKRFSVIVPVYNRPAEVDELLESLTRQSFKAFEVIVVEDGSNLPCEDICRKYKDLLDIQYVYKHNEGPGASRNRGCEMATTDFFIFFDSDCIVPPEYFHHLDQALKNQPFDSFGGPDEAAESFLPIQKAINYSMTSVLTTGGIRGGKKSVEKFHPRSFNMGISRQVYETTGGFSGMRYGEDIDFSIRIKKAGFRAVLLRECFVYHKRRLDFDKFFRQIFHSGSARINLYRLHPESLKLFHFFPAAFTVYTIFSIPVALLLKTPAPVIIPALYLLVVCVHASMKNGSVKVGLLATMATFVQHFAYGIGFLYRSLVKVKRKT